MTAEQLRKNLSMPDGKIDAVLDTDAFNETDDQYAIAYMLKSKEKINVRALYAAPFDNTNSDSPNDGMEKSYNEIIHILELMGKDEMKKNVFKGAKGFLENEQKPQASSAVEHLTNLALTYTSDNPLYVVSIGAITNVASAILTKPEIVNNIVVVWLGGHSREYKDTNEFNLNEDVAAARVVFSSGAPVVQLPCFGVVSNFTISNQELDCWFKGKNALCDYLVKKTNQEVAKWIDTDCDWTRILWDVTTIGWLLNDDDRFMYGRIIPIKVPTYERVYSKEESKDLMHYVYYIKRDELMRDMIEKLTK